MVIIENIQIGSIPILHVVQKAKREETLPFIIFVHGFESAKENNLHYAYLLAEKGFRVVLPEAVHHGERDSSLTSLQMNLHFWDIVISTIEELPAVKNYFAEKNMIDIERIGLAGTSMGGIITLGALTQYSWIKAAVSLMGMPYYEKFSQYQLKQLEDKGVKLPFSDESKQEILSKLKKYDLSLQIEALNRRPLLFWHGMKDPVVPYSYTYQFYEKIRPVYADEPEKLHFISDKDADHKVSREGVLQLVEWFEKYLSS